MDYVSYQHPTSPGPGGDRTVTGKLRVVSYLWQTTVPDNPFATDGPSPSALPKTWPGDDLRKCRQWHGIDLTVTFGSDGKPNPKKIRLTERSYSGSTDTCGMIGKTTVTDRHVTEPAIVKDHLGRQCVEVKTLLGTRLGAFIPTLHADLESPNPAVDAAILATSDDQYLGNNPLAPKIFTYAYLRLYPNLVAGHFVSKRRENGFPTQEEIVQQQMASSWIPEHHIYTNRNHDPANPVLSLQEETPPLAPDWAKWIDSAKPFDVYAFRLLSEALKRWEKETAKKDKQTVAAEFKKRYPDYFIGTTF